MKKDDQEKLKIFGVIQTINAVLSKIRESGSGIIDTNIFQKEIKKRKDEKMLFYDEVIFPKEGGILVTFKDKNIPPIKGFFFSETLETVDTIKKIGMAFVKVLATEIKRNPLGTIIAFVFFRKGIKEIIKCLLREMDWGLRRVRYKPRYYCKAVWAFYVAFESVRKKNPKLNEEISHLRNIVCMILEADNAYRYRVQDVFGEINKEKAKKDPIEELIRIADIWIEKETGKKKVDDREMKKFMTAYKIVWIKRILRLLKFVPQFKKVLRDFFEVFHVEDVQMDKEDYFHAFNGKQPFGWKSIKK